MQNTVMAVIDGERARYRRHIDEAERELKRLHSEPIPGNDGDEEQPAAGQLQRARAIDQVERDLEHARWGDEAIKHLGARMQEELAMVAMVPAGGPDRRTRPEDMRRTVRG